MRDINFFSAYQTNIKKINNDKKYVYILGSIVGGLIFLSLIVSSIKLLTLNSQIKTYTDKYNSQEIQMPLREADTVNDKLEILTSYEESLSDVVKAIKKNDVVNEKLLVDISSAVPGDISFSSWNTENYEITMKGTSKSRSAIAELEHNLRELPQFKYVHINSIKTGEKVGSDYTFDITTILKDGE